MTKPSSNPCTAASALASLRGHADPKRAAAHRTAADAIDTELLVRRDGSVLAVRFVY